MTKKQKKYSYKEICNILCEGCKLEVPMNTHIFDDKSYRLYHIIMGKDLTCDAAEWRRKSKMPSKHRRKNDKKVDYPEL